MGGDSHAEQYLRLGLQLGRHDDDVVDAYFGPPELKAAVDAADPVDPARLAASADGLLNETRVAKREAWSRNSGRGEPDRPA